MKVFRWSCVGLLCLIITAATGNSSAQTRTAATQGAISTIEVATQMDLAPTNCGILPEPMKIAAINGEVIGTWPILIAIPNFAAQQNGILYFPKEHTSTDQRLPGWWSTKLAWFVSQSYVGTVKVRGFNVKDNSPIYINWNRDELTAVAEFDPKKSFSSANGVVGWAFFPSTLWVSKAGCYRLEAEWDGGAWH